VATRVVQFVLDLKGDADAAAKETGSSLSSMASKATLATGALAALSGAVVGAAAAYASLLFDMEAVVDETNTLAQASGFTTAEIAGMRQMAVATGKSLSDVVPAKLAEQLLKAQQGSSKAVRAFAALSDASGMVVDTQADVGTVLRQSIDALAAIEDPTLRAGIAAQVGGKQFGQWLSAVGSSDAFDAFVSQAERFGIKVGPDAVAAVGEWQGANAQLSLAFDFAKQSLLDAFGFGTAAELISGFASTFVTMTQLVRTFTTEWLERAGFFASGMRALFDGISTFAAESVGAWSDLFGLFQGAATSAISAVVDLVEPAIESITTPVAGAMDWVGARVSLAADTIAVAFVDRAATILDTLSTIQGAAEDAAVGMAAPFVEAFEGILDGIKATAGGWLELARAIPGVSPALEGVQTAMDGLSERWTAATAGMIEGIQGAAGDISQAFTLPTTLVGKLASEAAATRAEFEALAAATGAAGGPSEAGAGAAGIQAAADLAAAQKEAQKEAEKLAKEAEKHAADLAKESAKQREEQIKLATEIANGSTASVLALEELGADLQRQAGPSVLGQSIGLAMAGPVGLIASLFFQLPDMMDGITEKLDGALEFIQGFPDALRGVLTETLPDILTEMIPALIDGVVALVVELPGIIIDAIPVLVAALGEMMAKNLASLPGHLFELVMTIPNLIIDAIKALPANIGQAVVDALGKGVKKVGDFIGPKGGILGTQLGAQADTKKIFGIELPFLDTGGTVTRTGLAVVHAGEEYSGVGRNRRSMGGGMSVGSITMNGVNDPRAFVDELNRLFGANGLNLPPLQGATP
jgi:hypothetical protein